METPVFVSERLACVEGKGSRWRARTRRTCLLGAYKHEAAGLFCQSGRRRTRRSKPGGSEPLEPRRCQAK
ncbi:hypothetical protein EYF80_032670 [Liparis tanakae]|uniref:Uncharacterized protein n=1 Tax=Liparis tanakae TaxID=230148 RepID=A0A4Z2GVG8_9TELE|nr:hypothetical protein EYF80_032670 [Liparis tanakae]